MFYPRLLAKVLPRYAKFPAIAVLGPRQAGKTTFAKHHFPQHAYVNLENPELRLFAKEDPNRFLREFENAHGMIIDEFQYVPELLSYIQVKIDEEKRKGYFVLTGSQNFLVNQSISQSLAGRVGILILLPFSIHELQVNNLLGNIDDTILCGAYPRIYEDEIDPIDYYPSYIHTYLERDVRQIAHVGDILIFQKLMKLCAGRVGQLLNISDLAMYLGVDQKKVKHWLSVLEASYVIFLLKPHFQNFNKRLTKTPKLYFYDVGLACSLLEIRSKASLSLSPFRGHLFESLMVSDLQKQFYNQGFNTPSTSFWRDQNGRIEVDCLVERGDALFPIEIKSGETVSPDFFEGIHAWSKLSGVDTENSTIIYGGNQSQKRSRGHVLGWQNAGNFIERLYSTT